MFLRRVGRHRGGAFQPLPPPLPCGVCVGLVYNRGQIYVKNCGFLQWWALKYAACRISPSFSRLYRVRGEPMWGCLELLRHVKYLSLQTPFPPFLTPENPHRFKIFFPRSYRRPCRAIRNWSAKRDLTPVNIIFLKKSVFPLVLLSDTPENPCFGQSETVSSR